MTKAIYELDSIGKDDALEAVSVHWYCSTDCQNKGIKQFPTQQPLSVSPDATNDFEDGAICESCNAPLIDDLVRCASFIPFGIQCTLPMYHNGDHVYDPPQPFSVYCTRITPVAHPPIRA